MEPSNKVENNSSCTLVNNHVSTTILTNKKWVSPQIEEWQTELISFKGAGNILDGSFKTYNVG